MMLIIQIRQRNFCSSADTSTYNRGNLSGISPRPDRKQKPCGKDGVVSLYIVSCLQSPTHHFRFPLYSSLPHPSPFLSIPPYPPTNIPPPSQQLAPHKPHHQPKNHNPSSNPRSRQHVQPLLPTPKHRLGKGYQKRCHHVQDFTRCRRRRGIVYKLWR